MDSLAIAKGALQAAEDKKAHRSVILDIRGLSVIADFFVITSGNSEKQVQSIATGIKEQLQKDGIPIRGIEGYEQGRWVLIDTGDVVVHVFHQEDRDFYGLERLWSDAKTVEAQ